MINILALVLYGGYKPIFFNAFNFILCALKEMFFLNFALCFVFHEYKQLKLLKCSVPALYHMQPFKTFKTFLFAKHSVRLKFNSLVTYCVDILHW